MKIIKMILLVMVSQLIVCLPSSSQGVSGQKDNPIIRMNTGAGDIEIELYQKEAPLTVENFLSYIQEEMFEGAHFYRVVTMGNQPDNKIRIEVIQGGLGWTDTVARMEPVRMETTLETGILHLDGTLSMARDAPDSADSEFFICVNSQPELDFGGHRNPDGQGFAAFGRVIKGMEVVSKIHQMPNKDQMLLDPVMIKRIERIR